MKHQKDVFTFGVCTLNLDKVFKMCFLIKILMIIIIIIF